MDEYNNTADVKLGSCVNDADASDMENGNKGENDFQDNLFTALNWIKANLDQLIDNCCSINDQMNNLEMDCIDLLQPIGDIIIIERELKRLSEIESIYMKALSELEN